MSLVAVDRPAAPVADAPAGDRVARTQSRSRPLRARRSTSTVGGHVLLVAASALSVLPVIWMFVTSLEGPHDLLSGHLLPSTVSGSNYRAAFGAIDVGALVLHTFLMAAAVSVGQLVTGILAAYAFARWHFPGERLLLLVVVGTWLVPFQVTMLPNYVLLAHLGLLNSLGGVIVPQLSSAFAVLLLRQYFKSFPNELLEAAQVDGQSSWATLWKVVVPNLGPALAALTILLFVTSWNEYFWPLIVYRDPNSSVLQLGLQVFLSTDGTNYGALMAASGLACLPLLAVYAVFQRRIVNAFVRSGLR